MSQESAEPKNSAASGAAQHRAPWTYIDRCWEPDFFAPELKLKPLDQVAAKPLVWEGDARLPRGCLTIIAGEHGSGKSLMTIDWAARISRGEPWAASCASDPAAPRNGEPEASASVSNRQPAAPKNGEPEASASVSYSDKAAPKQTVANASGSPTHSSGSPRAAQPKNYGEAVIAHAGDATVDLLRMRIEAAEAVPLRVASLALAWPEKGEHFSFDTINKRLFGLTSAIRGTSNVRLLVIDNLEAWAGNLHEPPSPALVGFLLSRLAELASLAELAIVVLAPLPRAGGQTAARRLETLTNAAPVVYLAASDPERPGRKLLLPVKNTLAAPAPATACEIIGNRVVWSDERVDATADEFIAPLSRRLEARHERESAARWLLAALADGPVVSRELLRQARDCGISNRTLRRAAQSLGLAPRKTSFDGPWQWSLGQPATPRNGEPEALASVSCSDKAAPKETEANASGSPRNASGSPAEREDGQPRGDELAPAAFSPGKTSPHQAPNGRPAGANGFRHGRLAPFGR